MLIVTSGGQDTGLCLASSQHSSLVATARLGTTVNSGIGPHARVIAAELKLLTSLGEW